MLTLNDRPFAFTDMIGQKSILKEMKNRSKTLDFPEIMLFQGPSGTGKTTLACIIAALLNDPNPLKDEDGTLEPNPSSPASVDIISTRYHRDTIFKDASSMSKDDVLNLSQEVATSPMYDKNKILIIDEAQFLSKMGKGAMLTFLEKKRKGTYVIMCTMDVSSFDSSIRSRAVEYRFRSPTEDEIAEYLFKCVEKLDIVLDEKSKSFFTDGLFTIAAGCNGSVRMALQMMERCIEGDIFSTDDITREFGIMSTSKFDSIIDRLINSIDKKVVEDINTLEPEDAYRMIMNWVSGAYLYKTTGWAATEWQGRQYSRVKSTYNIEVLVDCLRGVYTDGYFHKELFFYSLGRYFNILLKKDNAEGVPEGVTKNPPLRVRV